MLKHFSPTFLSLPPALCIQAQRTVLSQTEEVNQRLGRALQTHSELQDQLSETRIKLGQATLVSGRVGVNSISFQETFIHHSKGHTALTLVLDKKKHSQWTFFLILRTELNQCLGNQPKVLFHFTDWS